MDNEQVKVVIHVDFETMVKEVNVNEDIFRNEALNNITEMQNDYIINIMKKLQTIQLLQEGIFFRLQGLCRISIQKNE